MIQTIAIDRLIPHPENPRKDLGDLIELVESIKARGVLQNLTVVPFGDIYRVVIGHRRLAAAKIAGLKELPCAVVDMDERTQIATMLLENMHRTDLTLLEQAQGFQMMMDLGDSIKDISEKSGFSESTIRRRIKLLEYDTDKVQKSLTRGARLEDFIELEKITDPKRREKVLDAIGTNNYRWQLENALREEETKRKRAELIEVLQTFAVEVDETDGYRVVRYIYSLDNKEEIIPEDKDTVEYFFFVDKYSIDLLVKESSEGKDVETAEDRERKERQYHYKQLEETSSNAYKLRADFVKNCHIPKKQVDAIMLFAVRALNRYGYDGYTKMARLLGVDIDENIDHCLTLEELIELTGATPERLLLCAAFRNMDSPSGNYYNWNATYCSNDLLDVVYEALETLGYELSDEEKALKDGTHELYLQPDEEPSDEDEEEEDFTEDEAEPEAV